MKVNLQIGYDIMNKVMLTLLSVAFAVSGSNIANAQVKDQEFKDWTVYTTTLQGNKACYIASFPKSKTGNYQNRDEPYFLVTRISDDVFEVSTSSGYPYKVSSDVKISIDGDKYNMFTKGELAWASDSQQDNKMVASMKKKGSMEVRGTSAKGSYSVDKYSLSGFTAAYNRMKELCK